MMTDAQIEVAVRLNTAITALHEAIQKVIQHGFPDDNTMALRHALDIVLTSHRAITKEEK